MADDATRTFGGSEHGLPVEQALLLEEACDRFEARWRAGDRPDLAAAIRDLPEVIRPAAIRELIQLDVFYRGQLGETPAVADYAGDFPRFDPIWLCDAQSAEPRDGSSTRTAVTETARIIASTPLGRFGDYELLAVIAHGAMGVVYKARQIKLDRIVALKMIRSGEFADPGEIRRFRQEAESAATLDHPNIVSIFQVGEERGLNYFAMRLVEGGTLASRIGDFTIATAATRADAKRRHQVVAGLMATVARAVHHAHQRDVLHRDLKPANILLDAAGEPHVTDFGLARRIGADSTLTRTGAILGTPSYMAPEQARGIQDVTTEADVYGLGAVLYHLLAGRPPFQGEDILETLYQVRGKEPVRPQAICGLADRDLETICLKCLEKDTNKRYSSAAAMADDLERWLKGEAILARRAGTLERASKWARRNPALAALGGVSALMVLFGVGGAVSLVYSRTLEGKNRELELAKDEANSQRAKAEEQREEADLQRERARLAEARALSSLYVTQMNQVQKAYEDKRFGYALALLEKLRPERSDSVDHRGPEWHHMWRLCGGSQIDLRGHPASVTCAVYSPSGLRLASGDGQGNVKIWDLESHRELRSIAGSNSAINALCFSGDGKRLAVAGDDRPVSVWDVETGRELSRFNGHTDSVLALAFHPKGDRVVSGGRYGNLFIWDASSGQRIRTLSVAVEGMMALVGSFDKRLESKSSIRSLAIAADGRTLLVAEDDGSVRKWVCDADGAPELVQKAEKRPSPRSQKIPRSFAQHALSGSGRPLTDNGRRRSRDPDPGDTGRSYTCGRKLRRGVQWRRQFDRRRGRKGGSGCPNRSGNALDATRNAGF